MIQRLVAKRVTLPATQLAPPLVHERLDSWIPRISTGPEQPGSKPMLGASWSIYECHLSHLLDLKMITFHPPFCLHKPEAETTTALRHLPFLFQVRKRQTATYALFNLDGCVIQLRSCHPCPSTGLNFWSRYWIHCSRKKENHCPPNISAFWPPLGFFLPHPTLDAMRVNLVAWLCDGTCRHCGSRTTFSAAVKNARRHKHTQTWASNAQVSSFAIFA